MKLCTRAPAALLTLIALTLSFAEGVWASSCPPGMSMETSATEGAASDGMAGMDMEAGESESDSPATPPDPRCPLTPLSAPGSCVAASLPAAIPATDLLSPEGRLLTPSLPERRALLLPSTLFHPPKS